MLPPCRDLRLINQKIAKSVVINVSNMGSKGPSVQTIFDAICASFVARDGNPISVRLERDYIWCDVRCSPSSCM